MRGQYYILERQQRIVWWRWLLVEYVEAGAKQLIVCECAGECGLVDHRAAAGVDDDRLGLHRGKLVRADHVAGRRVERDVQGDDVGGRQWLAHQAEAHTER